MRHTPDRPPATLPTTLQPPPPPTRPQGATKFASALGAAAAGAAGDAALPLPDARYLGAVTGHRAGSTKSLTRAAADPELVAAFAAALAEWCAAVEGALCENEASGKDAEDAGVGWGRGRRAGRGHGRVGGRGGGAVLPPHQTTKPPPRLQAPKRSSTSGACA